MNIEEVSEDNSLCEICVANPITDAWVDIYWINTHCIELRKNRISREKKNIYPEKTFF